MNKSYKTIWNESLGAWVAASELATGRGKSSRTRKAARAVLAAGVLLQAGVMAPSVAVAGALDGGTVSSKNGQLAYGPNSEVLGIGPGVAIGNNASVFANDAIAIGFNVRANSAASIVMGNNASSDRQSGGSVVFKPGVTGSDTPVTNSVDTFAFINGRNTVTNSSQGVAIAGTLTNAGGGVAIGEDTLVTQVGGIAIGQTAQAQGLWSIGLGRDSLASKAQAVALGPQSTASGAQSVAVGMNSKASNTNALAAGNTANAAGNSALAVGSNTLASLANTVAIGNNARATGANALSVGNASAASGTDATAAGPNAAASGGQSVAVGVNSKASNTSAVATGNGATASGNSAVAVGATALATNDSAVAVGPNASASAFGASALGVNSKATGGSATALGNSAVAAGNSAAALGESANATGTNAVAVGASAKASSDYALAVGASANASAFAASALGVNSKAAGNSAVALGNAASASNVNAMAMGTNAVASGASAVTVGESSSATGSRSAAFGNSARALADDTLAAGSSANASGKQSVSVGYLSKASQLNSVAVGAGAVAGGNSSIAIGDNAQAGGTQAVGVGYYNNVSGNNSGAIGSSNTVAANNAFVMGNNISVGAGLAGTVVLGTGSAAVAATPVTNVILRGTTYNFAGTAPTSTVSVGAGGAERQITNVAAGRVSNTSTDAVNGSQLNATNLAVSNLAANGASTKYFNANSSGADSVPTGANSIAIGPDAVSAGANSMAAGQGAQSAGQLAVAVGPNANASAFGASALGVNSKATGGSATALGNSAVAAGNSAAAVGEGANATGTNAVAVGASAKASSDYALAVGASANASAFAASALGVNSKAAGNNAVALGNAASASNVNAMAMGTNAVASGASALTVGESSSASGSRSAAFGNSARALADDTLAAGSSANASGLQSVAIGSLTTATKTNAVALGASADATGGGAVAVGAGAGASGDGSAAFGVNSAASGERSVALGASANASAFGASALGVNTKATGGSATALGNSASAAGNSAAALGESANASGTNAVAVGASAKANSDYAVAVGSTSNASGLQSLAVGYLSKASKLNAVAVGTSANASGATSAALGGNSAAAGDQSVALGASANASAFGASALGVNSNAIGGSATALGNSASAAGNSTVALGESAKTSSNFALAAGASSNASGLQSLAVGYLSKASNTNAVAVGAGANAAGSNGVSVGANSAARLDNAVAVGNSALASGTSSIAIGNGAQATGAQSLSVGTGNKVSGNNSGAFGDPNTVTGAGSYAFGNNNTVAADKAFVMGNNVSVGASLTGAVVLGDGSAAVAATPVTGTTINGIGYAFAGTTPTSTVSVGAANAERQITNVAAGRLSGTSTDAVNGSQLFATNLAVNKLVINGAPTKYFKVNSVEADSVAQGAESVAIGPKAVASSQNSIAMGNNANANGIGDVAIGANSTATNGVNPVTGQVLRSVAIGENSSAAGGVAVGEKANAGLGSTALGNGSVAAQGGVAIGSRTDLPTSATGNGSVAVGALANASGEAAVVLGVMSSASNANTIAIGYLSNVSGSNSAAVGTSNKVASNKAFVLGNNVTVGTGLDGAVVLGNNSTVAAAQATTGTTINSKTYTFAGTTPAAGDVVSVGAVGAERQITNVAAGRVIAGSTDAVNGSQLYATNTELSNVGSTLTSITNGGKGIKYFHVGVSSGADSLPTGVNSIAIGPDAVSGGSSSMAAGPGARSGGNVAVAIGFNSNASGYGSSAMGVRANASGAGAMAIGFESQAAGESSIGMGESTNASGSKSAAFGFNANATGDNALAAGTSSTASGQQSVAVGFNSKASDTSALALGNNAVASGTQSIAIGNGAQATGAQSLSVGTGNKVSGNNSGAFGDPNTVTGAGSYAFGNNNTVAADKAFVMGNNVSVGASLTGAVVLGDGSAAVAATPVTGTTINGIGYAFAGTAPTSTVSVGAANAERQITNVAAGRLSGTSTDAVNGSQLFATNLAVNKLVINGAPTKYFKVNSVEADSVAVGAESVAIGPKAVASSQNSIAMGNNANANGIGDVAIGANSTAVNGVNPVTGQVLRSVAIGENSSAAGGVAVGEKANAGAGSTALGNGSVAAQGGVAIGSRTDLPTSATGNGSVAVGVLANASGESAVVLGVMSSASNANTIAIGSLSNVSGSNSAAVGTSNKVASNNAFVLGNNVTVGTGLNGAVVLGNKSTVAAAQATTGTTINGKAYTFAGTTPAAGDVVSVGAVGAERQITNVAAGRVIAGSTDAVNGSQLYATNTELSNVGSVVTNITDGGGIKYFRAKSTAADSQALGTDSVAVGPAAVASGTDSIAMGVNANASAFGASAIGVNSNATGGSATALGNSATATGNSAVALGESAKATSNFALAAGASSNASGLQSLAVGYLSKASNTNAMALGTNADASAFGASAMGVNATASGGSSIAMGNSAKASDNSAMAMGTNANASGNSSAALGEAANASGSKAVALGSSANASGNNSAALGESANASGSKAVAMGSSAKATDNYALAVGASSNASGLQSLAVGYLSKASQLNAVALGTGANAGGSSSVSIGDGSQAAGTQAVGVGYFSKVTGNNSGAIGSSNTVVANNAFVVGNNITVDSGLDGAVVLGDKSTVAASNPTANATVNGKNYTFAGAAPAAGGVVSVGAAGAERQITNVAAGRLTASSTDAVNGSQLYATNTELSNVGSVVNNISNGGGIKYFKANSTLPDSQAQGLDSVAIGPNAVAKNASDVALGNGSVTDTAVATAGATINNKAVTFAGSAPASTVSVGSVGAERTITNVAAGRLSGTSTDAVNGSQLYATNTELSNVGSVVNNISNGGGIKYFKANSTLPDSQAQGLDSVAIGPNAVAKNASDVALGNGSVTDTAVATAGATINNKAVTFAGSAPTSTVSVGSVGAERTITNVAAGRLSSSSTDAVNGSQLYATNTELSNVGSVVNNISNGGGIKYFKANSTLPDSQAQGLDSVAIGPNAVAKNASDVALGNGSVTDTAVATAGATINNKAVTFAGNAPTSTVSVGSVGAERTITNVAAGRLSGTSTDAVNGSQLYATNTELSNVGSVVNNISNGGGIKYFKANSTLADSQAQGLDSVAIGPNAVAKNASDVALGNGSVTDTAVTTTGATINNKAVTFAGNAPTSTVSVGSVGAERTITNVAAGRLSGTSTDAVNGSQLYATNTELSNVGSVVNNISNGGGIKYFKANSTLADSQAQGLDSVAIGPNAVAKNASDVALGNGSVTDTAVATAGATINNKAVTFAGNAPTSTVSVGSVGAERTITNVAAGRLTASSTDAVNGSQLYATNTELSNVGSVVNNISNGGGIKYFKANSTLADSQAQGLDSVAIGPNAVAKNASDVALGNGSVTYTAVGTTGATINGKAVTFAGNAPTSSVSVGSVGAERTITNVAAGRLSSSSTDAVNGSQLYATNTELSNVGSVVNNISNGGGIKYFKANSTLADSQAQGLDSVAIGPNAVAKNASDVALGNGSVTDTAVATAGATINNKAVTFAGSAPTSTVSVGSVGAERTITNVAAGRLTASSTDAVNGSQLYATNNELSNVGSTVTTITNGGGIKYFRANSTGADSLAQALESVAIGPNAVANNVGDVALGAGSTTNTAIATAGATINGKAVTFAGSAPTSTVSVGSVGAERTITNVAAGQLSASSTDAVNGSQLYATNNELSNVGSTVTTITNGGGIKYFRANSTGADSLAQALESVAIGPNAVAKNVGDVALGSSSVTDTAVATAGATINGKAVTFAGNAPTSTVSVGSAGAERTITNVAAGQLTGTSTDAVNGSQLYATNNELSNVGSTVTTITNGGGIKYFRANSTGADSLAQALESVAIGPNAVAKNVGDVALGSGSVTDTAVATTGATINGKAVTFAGNAPTSTVSVGSVGAERTITNVAAGRLSGTSTDAVNGSQLYATNTELSNVGSVVNNISNGGGIKYFKANSTLPDSQAQGLDSVAIGPNAVAKNASDVALGNGSVTDTAVATAGATINNKAVTFAGSAPTSTVSVGSVGAERTITNVAAGRLTASSTDAVNGSQLYATNTELSNVGSVVNNISNGGGIKYFKANSTQPDASATGTDSVAIGQRSVASGSSAFAAGSNANASSDGAIAVGTGANASGIGALALGITSVASGTGSIGIGALNNVSGETSAAVGVNNTVASKNSFVLGNYVNVASGLDGAVVLGYNSTVAAAQATPGATINGKAYTFAGAAPAAGDVVSVGRAGAERQITNVAAGQLSGTSTDAVNGSQLYATNTELSNVGSVVNNISNGGGIKYFKANSTLADSQAQGLDSVAIGPNAVAKNASDVALGNGSVTDTAVATTGATINGKAVTFAGNAPTSTVSVGSVGAERTITNVAAGRLTASSTDAVNGSQLYATNTELSNVGSVVNNISNGGGIKYFKANSTLPDSQAQGLDSVAIGPNAVAKNASDVALGNGSVTDTAVATAGATINNKAVTFAGSAPTSTVSVGAAGAERTITNVAAGRLSSSSTDAVNGSQLYATNTELSNVGSVVNNISNGGGIKYFKANSTLPDSQAQGLDSVAIGPNAVAKNASDVALGNGSVTDTAVATTGATINNKAVTFAGNAPTSTVSVGSVGAERTITNVAAGRLSGTSTDAVNGSQLYATNTELSNVGSVVNNISNGGGIKYFKANSTLADSQAQGLDSVAIGPNAVAKNASDVALGNGSVTDTAVATAGATINNKAVTFAGNAPTSTVSVGSVGAERTITNVAAGRLTASSTDAVNGSQLYATNTELSNVGSVVNNISNGGGIKYFKANSTLADSQAQGLDSVAIGPNALAKNASDVALGNGSVTDTAVATANAVVNGTTYNFAGTAPTSTVSVGSVGAERTIINVAAGRLSSSSTDAVNGSQLYATNMELSNVGWVVNNISNGGGIKYFKANSSAADSKASGNDSVAIGPNAVANSSGGVALGAGSVANKGAGIAGYVPPSASASAEAAIDATTSTQGAVSVGDAANGIYRQINGVAAGTADSDAVNVAQLKAVSASVSTAGDKWIVGSPTSYKAPTSTGTDSTAVGSGASVTANNSVAMGTGASVTADKSVALGNGATASTANSVALGNESKTSAAVASTSVTLQGTTYTFAGGAPVGVVSVGSAGAERQITNVAAGQLNANSTDAVNGSQLYATNQALSNIQGGGGIKYFRANSKAADSSADGAESVAIGPQAVSTGDGSVAMGNGAKSNAANSVALGAGSTADRTGMAGKKELFSNTVVNSTQGAVSVGSAGNERQITNVAGGTEATDAVNVRQLQAVKAGSVQYDTNVDGSVNQNSITLGGSGSSATAIHNVAAGVAGTDAANVDQVKQMGQEANTYTDLRSNQLRADIQTTAKDASAGTAGAMAMAGMPQASIPGKSMWTAGAAAYDGQAAVAIGVSKLADNGRWVIKFSGSANSRGKTGVSVGAGFHW